MSDQDSFESTGQHCPTRGHLANPTNCRRRQPAEYANESSWIFPSALCKCHTLQQPTTRRLHHGVTERPKWRNGYVSWHADNHLPPRSRRVSNSMSSGAARLKLLSDLLDSHSDEPCLGFESQFKLYRLQEMETL